MPEFTVIGAYDAEGTERYAGVFTADSAAQAELMVPGDVWVAMVVAGSQQVDREGEFPEGTEWTVAAFYTDNHQRYSAVGGGATFAEAELAAREAAAATGNGHDPAGTDSLAEQIVICGSMVGSHECVDVYAGDEYWARPPAQRPECSAGRRHSR
jgi:hypothetical protein